MSIETYTIHKCSVLAFSLLTIAVTKLENHSKEPKAHFQMASLPSLENRKIPFNSIKKETVEISFASGLSHTRLCPRVAGHSERFIHWYSKATKEDPFFPGLYKHTTGRER